MFNMCKSLRYLRSFQSKPTNQFHCAAAIQFKSAFFATGRRITKAEIPWSLFRLPFKWNAGTGSTVTCTTRLFGSKAIPSNPPGNVFIYNDQQTLKDIDENAICTTVQQISKQLGYETYDVTLLLVDDEEMRETNLECRGIDSPTDILSFPFHPHKKPGVLEEPEFDIPDYYTLGDMVVCVPYVIRRCQEDLLQKQEIDGSANNDEDALGDYDDDFGEEGGVSGAMADISDPEQRIRMLLVHGMLHLVGYDHIDDDDYEEMIAREEEILGELGYM